jgi:hypothetical protein
MMKWWVVIGDSDRPNKSRGVTSTVVVYLNQWIVGKMNGGEPWISSENEWINVN